MKALLFSIFIFSYLASYAQETEIVVRARAKDAKYIGNSIGGAYIIIRDKITQEILAQGLTDGGTGDTKQLLQTPQSRNQRTTDNNTSKFLAKLNLSKPVFVTVEAVAPVNYSSIKATTELWLIPGKHINQEGIILEIPGFIVDILTPTTHQYLKNTNTVNIKANVVMMCGCPITHGGVWNANEMEVKAILKKEGKIIGESLMKLTEENTFEVALTTQGSGYYEILVYAFNPTTSNTGIDIKNFVIR